MSVTIGYINPLNTRFMNPKSHSRVIQDPFKSH